MADDASWPMLRAMAGIGAICGGLIVTVYEGTAPRIERNRAEALERAVFDVLPGARTSHTFATEDGPVRAGYDDQGRLVGFALETQGMGYQDVIHVLYGYDPAAEEVVGLNVLESRETPGLGDRIQTDPGFLANFEHLDVALAPGGSGLRHPIELVKAGTKTEPWQIDAISGATISSTAIAQMLARSTERRVPDLHGRLDELSVAPEGQP